MQAPHRTRRGCYPGAVTESLVTISIVVKRGKVENVYKRKRKRTNKQTLLKNPEKRTIRSGYLPYYIVSHNHLTAISTYQHSTCISSW